VIVAASTSCIPNLPLPEIFDQLADQEYTNVEIVIDENSCVKPEELSKQFDQVVHVCRTSRRITPVAFHFGLEPTHPNFLEYFNTACRLAKMIRVVAVSVRASTAGTPFNVEVERLKQLVDIGIHEGVVVGLATESGRLTELPGTVGDLCKSVEGLGVSLDPSHYIYNHPKPRDYDGLIDHVYHVRLRDTTKTNFQVRIGQGSLDFGRFVTQLQKVGYHRALCVDLAPLPDVDSTAELRKLRMLLEAYL
jgi:sugar phosphate isomerase/epimerase